MSWGAVAIAAGSVIGGALSNKGAKDAAKAQGAAGDAAIYEQRAAREQFQQNIAPFLNAGQQALPQLNALASGDYSGFLNSPDYQFANQQGLQALDRSAAARGSLFSGGADADRIAFGQGLASQQLGTHRNYLMNLASMGQNAAVGAGTAAQNTANSIGSILQNQGQAQAAGAINSANSWGNALQGVAGAAGNYLGQRGSAYQNATASPYSANQVQVGNNSWRW